MTPPRTSARVKDTYTILPEEAVEPEMSPEDLDDFKRGIDLFNAGEFWESHEAWEFIWKRHKEPSRIFFQGLIQLAASHHQLQRGIYHGVVKHYNNAYLKLAQFPDAFLGIDVGAIKRKIQEGLAEAERLGAERLKDFDPGLITAIKKRSRDK